MASFTALDDDLLLSILPFSAAPDLARCRAVCRSLRQQADVDALWERHCRDESLQRNGSGGKHFSDAALSAVAAGCAELRSLHHGNLLLASNLLVSPWAVSLTSLNLTGSAWLSDSAVRRLAACASLQELWLSTCSGLRDGGLAAIASSCLRLRLVAVSNCRRRVNCLQLFRCLFQ